MKILAGAVLAALVLVAAACSQSAGPSSGAGGRPQPGETAPTLARVGALAPDFTVKGIDGTRINLARFRGKAVFINVFATWCPPCKEELPQIVASYPKYSDKIVFLGLDEQEEAGQVTPFVKQFHIAFQVGLDPGTFAEKYEVGSIPESVFIDKYGVVRKIWRGFLPAGELHDGLSAIVKD